MARLRRDDRRLFRRAPLGYLRRARHRRGSGVPRHEAVAVSVHDRRRDLSDQNLSRTTTRVLMRLDPAKLDLTTPRVHRQDGDFAVTWAKMYGKGRVFYSTLGHVE